MHFHFPSPNEKLFPSRNYQGKGYKLSAQGFLGSFGWTSVAHDWLMVALDTTEEKKTNKRSPKGSLKFLHREIVPSPLIVSGVGNYGDVNDLQLTTCSAQM